MRKHWYKCIVTGDEKYIPPSIIDTKLRKFGSIDAFKQHYISPAAKKLLKSGLTVQEIRDKLNIKEKLPDINLQILSRLRLLKVKKRKSVRSKTSEEQLVRQKYLNSSEFKNNKRRWEEHKRNMTLQEWVEENTGIGRHLGGTCLRPDIFLSWNHRACDECPYYEYCLCYQKRLSHEKKPKRRK